MKKTVLTFAVIAMIFSGCFKKSPTFPWFEGTLEVAQTLAGTRIIQIDFYTDT